MPPRLPPSTGFMVPTGRRGFLSPLGPTEQELLLRLERDRRLAAMQDLVFQQAHEGSLARQAVQDQRQRDVNLGQLQQQLAEIQNRGQLDRVRYAADSERAITNDRLGADAQRHAMALQGDRDRLTQQHANTFALEQLRNQFVQDMDRTRRGYAQEDAELDFLRANDDRLQQRLGGIHQLYGKMDPAGQKLYQGLASQIQALDQAFYAKRQLTPQQYFRKRAELGTQLEAVPWAQYLTTKPGEIVRRGIYEGVIDPQGQWKQTGIAADASPDEIRRHVESFTGVQHGMPYVVDPDTGRITFTTPRAAGTGAGAGTAGGLSDQQLMTLYRNAEESLRQQKIMASGDLNVAVTPAEIQAEMQRQLSVVQSLRGGQPASGTGVVSGSPSAVPGGTVPPASAMDPGAPPATTASPSPSDLPAPGAAPPTSTAPSPQAIEQLRTFDADLTNVNAAQMFMRQALQSFADPATARVEDLPPDVYTKFWQAKQTLEAFRRQGAATPPARPAAQPPAGRRPRPTLPPGQRLDMGSNPILDMGW